MGTMRAMGMAQCVREGEIDLTPALAYHLAHNHFPPVDTAWIGTCKQVIELAQEGEDLEDILLPHPIGGQPVTAAQVLEGLHLHAFVNPH